MKIDHHTIQQLSTWISRSSVGLLELTTPETSLCLRRDAPGQAIPRAPVTREPVEATPSYELTAPAPGIYLDRHPLSAQPLVSTGESIAAGQLVGFLQVRSLLIPLRSARAGRIVNLPQEPGNRLGYGSVVMRLLAAPGS